MVDKFNLRGDKLEVARSNSRAIHQFQKNGEWQLIPLITSLF